MLLLLLDFMLDVAPFPSYCAVLVKFWLSSGSASSYIRTFSQKSLRIAFISPQTLYGSNYNRCEFLRVNNSSSPPTLHCVRDMDGGLLVQFSHSTEGAPL